jgi:hypothetical protein
MKDDLGQLRADHPGWRFGTVWATAATGPDVRRLWACNGSVRVHAWTAAELSERIRQEERHMDDANRR